MGMILLASGCFILCSLSDKYAVSRVKMSGIELTCVMAAGTALVLTILLPFMGYEFHFSWQGAAFIALVALDKTMEFGLSAIVLREMSAFELKAWVGLTLFASYFLDSILYSSDITLFGLLFIAVALVGLFMIAAANRKQVRYLKIAVPLLFYLIAKVGYGLIMTKAEAFMPRNIVLYFALILLAVVLAPFCKWKVLFTEKRKGTIITFAAKIPNAVGLLAESAVIATSMTGFSLIQPITMVALFFVGILLKDKEQNNTPTGIIGGVITILGVIGFQLLK